MINDEHYANLRFCFLAHSLTMMVCVNLNLCSMQCTTAITATRKKNNVFSVSKYTEQIEINTRIVCAHASNLRKVDKWLITANIYAPSEGQHTAAR